MILIMYPPSGNKFHLKPMKKSEKQNVCPMFNLIETLKK